MGRGRRARRAGRRRRDPRLLQHLPAPRRARGQGRVRPRRQAALPVPQLDLCPRRLAGERARRRDFPDGFSFADNGLRPVHCEVCAGFVFINLDPGAPSLADWLGTDRRRRHLAGRAAHGRHQQHGAGLQLEDRHRVQHRGVPHHHRPPDDGCALARLPGTTHELYDHGHSRMVVPNLHYDTSARGRRRRRPRPRPGADGHANVSYLLFPFHLMPSGGGASPCRRSGRSPSTGR